MNAGTLVDLLLELNVINVKDVDNEINRLAARIVDPRAQKWFRRVPRYFLINIDRLFSEPYVAKAEQRGPRASKYYYHPKGGWVKGREPEAQPGSPVPVREEYDPEKQTYTSNLHQPDVQKDIDQSFTPFKPAKAKAKRLFGEPPVKSELEPWMTSPDSKKKEFHHFDPIQTSRRALFSKLTNVVHYLNYQTRLATGKPEAGDDAAGANKAEAEMLLRRLETMKTDDVAGFRDVVKQASTFATDVKAKPWLFTKDGQLVASNGNFTMRKAIFPETVVAFSKRGQPVHTSAGKATDGGYLPVWCTKAPSHANTYATQGPLYFIDRDNQPYVLAHFESSQVYGVHDSTLTEEEVKNIAPLFLDEKRFPLGLIARGSGPLAKAVERLRSGRR